MTGKARFWLRVSGTLKTPRVRPPTFLLPRDIGEGSQLDETSHAPSLSGGVRAQPAPGARRCQDFPGGWPSADLDRVSDGPSRHTHPYKQPAEPKGSFNYGCPWTGGDPGDRADCDATQSPRVPYLERNPARWSHPHFFYLAAETDSDSAGKKLAWGIANSLWPFKAG